MIEGEDALLNKYGDIMVRALRARLVSDGTTASGKTSRSILYSINGSSIDLDFDETLVALSDGLKPRGSVGGGGNGVDEFTLNIMDWMRARGITPMVQKGTLERRMRSSAWLISRAIRRRGTIKAFQHRGSDILDIIDKESKIMDDFAIDAADLLIDSLKF